MLAFDGWPVAQSETRRSNFDRRDFRTAGWVAQLVEQRTENPCVGGSIPPPATTLKGRIHRDEIRVATEKSK
jgi:hypothetical protein